jgi:hypothetical protein
MSLTNGQQILVRRLLTMSGLPNVVLPNGPGKELPRFVVQASGGGQQTATLDGISDATPEIVVTVETDTEFATENDALVSALVAHFPPGLRVEGLTITDAPLPRPPVPSVAYSVPVIIRGAFSF